MKEMIHQSIASASVALMIDTAFESRSIDPVASVACKALDVSVAIAIIFHNVHHASHRSFWVSAVIPYIFVGLLGVGLIALLTAQITLDAFLLVSGAPDSLNTVLIAAFGLFGSAVMLAAMYWVIPR